MLKILFLTTCFLLAQAATAQTCIEAIPASTPDSRFIVNGDEVTDTETGLIWQRCSLGQINSDCSGGAPENFSWQQALQAAVAESVKTGKSWRLPNIKELRSIVEEKCHSPAINLAIFPNTMYGLYYWSASPSAYYLNFAWSVNFDDGYTGWDWKEYDVFFINPYVRLVRSADEL